MDSKKTPPLSSREVLAKLGINGIDHAGESDPETLCFDDDEPLASPLDDLARALQQRFTALTGGSPLRPGDTVVWKEGLRNRLWPSYGKPAIVIEVLDPPVFDAEKNSGSPYFREPLSITLGTFIEEGPHRGDFMVWHVDGRRFQHWHKEEN